MRTLSIPAAGQAAQGLILCSFEVVAMMSFRAGR